jgi:signal transduction histidine kinase
MRDMRLIGRDKRGPVLGPPSADDLDEDLSGWLRYRRLVIRVLVASFVLSPAVAPLVAHGLALTGQQAFLVFGTGAFAALVDRTVLVTMAAPTQPPSWHRTTLPVTIALGGALFAVGQMSWLTALAVASAAAGRLASSTRVAGAGLLCCTGLAAGIGLGEGLGYGNTVIAIAVVVLAGMLAYSAERRNALVYRLRETRAELARAAVAEERLRISRDLHDLLGHSLSLIALKAELAGRLIGKDPDRAAREIADLETVARRSLTEVRQAVTGYRQPSLAAETGELAADARLGGRPVRGPGAGRLLAANRRGCPARVDGPRGRHQHRAARRRQARGHSHRGKRHRGGRLAVRRRHRALPGARIRERRRHGDGGSRCARRGRGG